MDTPAPPARAAELAHFVDAFEEALARDPGADPAGFLPGPDHPLHLAVLAELIRVDLDHTWAGRRPRRLAEYRDRFPALFASDELLREVAFEEYRQRRLHGDAAEPEEYRAAYGIDTSNWPTLRVELAAAALTSETPPPLSQTPPPDTERLAARPPSDPELSTDPAGPPDPSDPESVYHWLRAMNALPGPGAAFLGFRLEEELGRGAFGRVYLARQGDLGGRPVALKVACDIFGESRTLAQLQHTNIVPIYSFHRAGPFQAVCMPFFGRTTLAQVVQQLSHRPSLPHSGRELRSTVNLGKASTVPAHESGPPAAEPPPATEPPAPAPGSPDGWTQLDGLSYVEAVLWLGAQLADGLAHAHQRGIVHRDLKPANVLLTDDGRPMLLDFNLAEDTKLRQSAEGARMGGTLPYMAPEQIAAYRRRAGTVDGRCDLFALGVILFELLTGRHPYPVRPGSARAVVDAMLADRRQPPPGLRRWNPAVPPAAEAIVRKCLAPDPADRYQRAEHLREDLQRQLDHRPLKHAPDRSVAERMRKWARRHPRLTSSGTVAFVAAALLLGVGAAAVAARERAGALSARAAFADHRAAFRDAQVFLDDRHQSLPRLDEGLARLRGVLARYGVPDDPTGPDPWASPDAVRHLSDRERRQLREDVAEAFYRMAQVAALRAEFACGAERARQLELAERWNAAAERYGGDRLPRAVREQRAELAALAGDAAAARAEADRTPAESARDHYLLGVLLARKGRHRDALPHLRAATQLDPENFSAWFVRGTTHLALEQNELAALCFGSCTALRKEFAPAWLNRGLAYARLRFFDQACDDYDRAIKLDPALTEAYVLRAGARFALRDLKGAVEDYTHALDTGSAPVRVYFLRADVRRKLGDKQGAEADRAEGLRREPSDELSWVARAENRLDDPTAALADVEEALKLNPVSVHGLQLKAHILAERLGRPEEAVRALDRAVEYHPDHAAVRAGRGVLLARAGKRDEALRDAKDALLRDTKAPNLYQVGCIYALTSKGHPEDQREAFRLLWAALKTGFGLDLVDTDPDLDPVRPQPEFQRLVRSARALQAGSTR